MHSGYELIEKWIPTGGFKLERRKARAPDRGAVFAQCLVPKWQIDDLMPDQPCARQPCLHRVVADCPPEKDAILDLAGRYRLLTVSLSRSPAPGKPVPSALLPPEPVEVWKTTIREPRSAADLWDRIAAGDVRGRELFERKLAANLAHAPFHLTAVDGDSGPFRLRYCPPDLRAALWQSLAGEAAGLIRCVRCPAPSCGRCGRRLSQPSPVLLRSVTGPGVQTGPETRTCPIFRAGMNLSRAKG
jgi:hypothetical protein